MRVCAKPKCPVLTHNNYYCAAHVNEPPPSAEEYLELLELYAWQTSRDADDMSRLVGEIHTMRQSEEDMRRAGGRERAQALKQEAAERRARIQEAWVKLRESHADFEIPGILAKRYSLTPKTIRKYRPKKAESS